MSDGILKKTGQTAQDTAQQIARQVGQELLEIPESIPGQLAQNTESENTSSANNSSPIVEAIGQGTTRVSKKQHKKIHKEEKKKLDYLQKELEELAKKKNLQIQQSITQDQKEVESNKPKVLPPVVEPTSAPQRGKMQPQHKRRGSHELSKVIAE